MMRQTILLMSLFICVFFSVNAQIKCIDILKTFSTTKVTEEERTENASMTKSLIATLTFAQDRFCKFFKAQL